MLAVHNYWAQLIVSRYLGEIELLDPAEAQVAEILRSVSLMGSQKMIVMFAIGRQAVERACAVQFEVVELALVDTLAISC
jgi:hypothetical protein